MTGAVRTFAILLALAAVLAASCGDSDSPTAPTPRAEFSQTDLQVGTGAAAAPGTRVTVNYTGWLYDPAGQNGRGRQFDSSVGRGPFAFTLGANPPQVIRGWEQGVPGMRVGGVRRLVIPPELAYGASGNGPIPPNATLVFDIELLAVQ